ncbi:UbiX family flavin prenyltransferase [Campylobacter fetus]|uniref:UbiX family flavin prenyltransferase n=1 Tax=Campylobacter fetus TaxID=196 RepID=UPI000818C520|nr:UbiX family flavin prenyltransferase [Campylobacter fetus]EAK0826998.1 UbiX family flavin prenyltransferase [Campylobacter fetus]OCR91846.1 3-octaprenyl-4-hydroxybenzoate carboxy-lyase [Campylobacter fetus subsp. testudinum]OCS03183.1 3-octaprenyl-4-hydroxybenzoate carboxy-lyase [Campylobacter fetus subsp. testudinum]
MKTLVAISGASGAHLGIKLANVIASLGNDTHIIISENALISMQKEEVSEQIDKNIRIYSNNEIWAAPASGSSKFENMIIAPCSINSLAKIASSISDNLILRAAAVMIKEHKKLVLGVREMPLSAISLRQMADLAALGVIIAPPIIGYYSGIKSLKDMENFVIGKWLDTIEIKHDIFSRWK